MQWSEYQEAIFDRVVNTRDNLIVEAVAGSGKTTTLVEIIKRLRGAGRGGRILMAAFNVRIVQEMNTRVAPSEAACRTLHSIGRSAWMAALGWDANNCTVSKSTGGKTRAAMDKVMSWPQKNKYGQMTKLIGIAKGMGIVPLVPGQEEIARTFRGLVPDTEQVWRDIVDTYDLEQFTEERTGALDKVGIACAKNVLVEGIRQARAEIDFDDMLYMPVVATAPFEQFDVVLLDEAQDVNPLQVEIVRRALTAGGRVIAVGDPHQAIYGFRGAMNSSLSYIGAEFNCERMPLSVCYRCGTKIVDVARQYVKHIQPFEGNEAGIVETPARWELADFQPTDVILCRLNAPLINLAFMLIRNKVGCQILGKDIASGLTALVKRMKAIDVMDLLVRLQKYHEREVVKANGDEEKIARVGDKIATLHVFIEELAPHERVEDLISNIEFMFKDEQKASRNLLTLSTVHKAKGMEWDRVFVLDAEDLMPLGWAKDGWQMDQEINLCYVAATRAKRELRYVSSRALGLPVREAGVAAGGGAGGAGEGSEEWRGPRGEAGR